MQVKSEMRTEYLVSQNTRIRYKQTNKQLDMMRPNNTKHHPTLIYEVPQFKPFTNQSQRGVSKKPPLLCLRWFAKFFLTLKMTQLWHCHTVFPGPFMVTFGIISYQPPGARMLPLAQWRNGSSGKMGIFEHGKVSDSPLFHKSQMVQLIQEHLPKGVVFLKGDSIDTKMKINYPGFLV